MLITTPTIVLVIVITLCILAIHTVATKFPRQRTDVNSLDWLDVKVKVAQWMPGKPQPSYASYHYVSAVDLVSVIDTPKYSVVVVSRGGEIIHTTLNMRGYVLLGDMILVEGYVDQRVESKTDGEYRMGNMTAYSFKKNYHRSHFTPIHTVAWDA